ncbi:hypothetical protein XIS1_400006 [Xenorhabdus innexi]|uniref:Uncharacterized protein n=1 Tax=Xenorhabdus innexi TaxID=290109 RepID=A0A1N6MXU1_9GAMM|nr:hypothetical protein XIS1_400006 [Xenorhabdus innexi]
MIILSALSRFQVSYEFTLIKLYINLSYRLWILNLKKMKNITCIILENLF